MRRRASVVEGDGSRHEEVLVGAVGGTLAVHVVLVQGDRHALAGGGGRRTPSDLVARAIPHDRVPRVRHLRTRVLGVGVIDVEARAVAEHGVEVGRILPRTAPAAQGYAEIRARGASVRRSGWALAAVPDGGPAGR